MLGDDKNYYHNIGNIGLTSRSFSFLELYWVPAIVPSILINNYLFINFQNYTYCMKFCLNITIQMYVHTYSNQDDISPFVNVY